MTAQQPPQTTRSSLPFALAFIAGVAGIYWYQSNARKQESPPAIAAVQGSSFTRALAVGPMAGVIVHDERRDIRPFMFKDAQDGEVGLSSWKGRVVLLNLWATWCTPCRKEMPDLAALQKSMGGPDFEVVALSLDKQGAAVSKPFLAEVGAENLGVYTDTSLKSMAELQAIGLPATLLIDKQGKEAARLLGPANWNAPEAQAMIKALLAE